MEPTRRVLVASAFLPSITGCSATPVVAEFTSPWGDVATGADAEALLASAAAGGCAAGIVQRPGHAVALRRDQGGGEWFLLDSQAPGARRLEGAEALVGSVWTLVQADGEGDFLPQALQVTWPAVVACASWCFGGLCKRLWMILARRSGATGTP
jgi:hypothetical protein